MVYEVMFYNIREIKINLLQHKYLVYFFHKIFTLFWYKGYITVRI